MLVINPFLCLESHFCGKKYKSVRWGKPGLWKKLVWRIQEWAKYANIVMFFQYFLLKYGLKLPRSLQSYVWDQLSCFQGKWKNDVL